MKTGGIKLHYKSIVVDCHNDTMLKVIDENTWLPKVNIGENTDNHIDIPKLVKGGLNVPFFAAFTAGYYGDRQKSISSTLAPINALYWTERQNKDKFKIVRSVEEIVNTVKEGKIAAVRTIEGAYSLDENNSIELLKQYYDLGIRAIAFNWNYSNDLGEGCSRTYNDDAETPTSGGLTELGKKVALEMNRLGIIIDVSHMAEDTFWDIINVSKAPIIASHAGVYSLRNHRRNLTDDQLKALAKNRGVVGIVLCAGFLTDKEDAYLNDYVDHIDYAVNLIGIDHVGIGSDFDGAKIPKDIKDSSELYKVTDELIKRGYKDEDIEKLLGKNILRVLKEVEEIAEKSNELDLNIIPSIDMGEIIDEVTPLLTAKVENIKGIEINSRIIVDGIPYNAEYNKDTSILSLKIVEPLRDKFHVVTFEVIDNADNVKRETIILYVK